MTVVENHTGALASVCRPRIARYGIIPVLALLLLAAALAAATIGVAGIPPARLAAAFGFGDAAPALLARDQLVLWSVRLPRIAMAVMVGAFLAGGGTLMQGLFRNPLADPGLIGVSAGAALAAAAVIVFGDRFEIAAAWPLHVGLLPVAAFLGALITTAVLYRVATVDGRTSIATFLLAGFAVGALAMAGVGLLVFTADDRQLRDITFWTLGSLGGATWAKVAGLAPILALEVAAIPFLVRGLDALVLGEAEAFHLGISVERLKRWTIVLVAAAAGAAVSVAGVIGFVGIIVPHLLRLTIGPGHRLLLPASLLAGALLMLAADTFARVVASPAELPVGIVTAMIGAPFFLFLLVRHRALAGF